MAWTGLYEGKTVTLTGSVALVSTLAGTPGWGWKVSFLRAGSANAGTATIGFNAGFASDGVGGYVAAGQALAFDHPRPDARQLYLNGTANDTVAIIFIHEMAP